MIKERYVKNVTSIRWQGINGRLNLRFWELSKSVD